MAALGPWMYRSPGSPSGTGLAVVAAQFDVVARHRPAGGAVAHPLGPVADEDVQHLGAADAVDDVDAEVALEALAQFGRQRFAGRRHQAQRHVSSTRRQVGVRQHAGKAGGGAVEHRGLEPARPRPPALEGGVGRGPLAHQQRGGAHAHREGQRIAQAVGEEQLGGREADVVLAQAQHALAVQLGRSSRGWRASAPCPWAGRWSRWNRARSRGRRRRWRPAWRRRVRGQKASNSTSDGCSGATGRDTITLPTSWSLLTMAAVSAGSSAPDTSTAWARECSSM
jgi:hypothetical protein